MSVDIIPIKAFSDNYIWCLRNQSTCTVVDPGDAKPVLAYCQQNQLILTDILITHHHWDHTNGLDELLKAFPSVNIYGPQNQNITQITKRLSEDDSIYLSELEIYLTVLEVPGHTLDHIAYISDLGVFCGDTMFSAGCGRLFEGTPKQMHDSLLKLTSLPKDTAVYCTHEYTLANIAFAETAEPKNEDLLDYKAWAIQQRVQSLPTLPSSIGQECKINPFLRCDSQELINKVMQHAGKSLDNQEQVFAALRSWKDSF